MFLDTHKTQGMRKRLVEELSRQQIASEQVLTAMLSVPRHFFIPKGFEEHAYQNKAFRIGAGQTISHPSTVAIQSSLLDLKSTDKVLEIGTGSGYQTAILCELGVKVFSIERQKELYESAKKLLYFLNYNPRLYFGDGYKGNSIYGPYDKIIVTCGAPFVPELLVEQLKNGGKMVIPVGEKEQKMLLIEKSENGQITVNEIGKFKFVPMLEKKVR